VRLKMKPLSLAAASLAATVCARSLHNPDQQAINLDAQQSVSQEKCLIELSPGETRWVLEDEKWELMRVCPILPAAT
jgi:bacterial leucyl aminopeptidase